MAASLHITYVGGAQHHDVPADDPEYKKIKSDLENAGLVLNNLVKLTNSALGQMFQMESDYLLKNRPREFSLNIQNLYHGTTAPFNQICDEGLDERLSRSGRFGRGIYFSDNPAKCCKYAQRQKSPSYLLRCKVIMGDVKEYTAGKEDRELQKEPLKTVKDGKRVYYDSVMGQPRDHKEYVIYEKRRALIEYVAFYSKSASYVSKNETRASKARLEMTVVPGERYDETIVPGGRIDETIVPAVTVERYHNDSEHLSEKSDSRSSTPLSDRHSPTSGHSTPVDSGDEITDTQPVTYEPVKRVNVVRQRNKVPVAEPAAESEVVGATAASVVSTTASSAPSTTIPSRFFTSEAITSPQTAALRYLISMKDKLPPDQLETLTREYHRTYGALGSVAAASSNRTIRPAAAPTAVATIEPDPVSQVMSKLVQEFQDVTQCSDVQLCQQFIEGGNMDLNRAVEAYMDATS